ncbi:MAG TPA: sigma-70 family RNA polymerase sigma factor [Dyadobacter sp.]|jgi:RNA polymerase sigma-70 factor (ECF subfamily)|nr:sigma-70 family RNA polymerase sigma factor [Dyadobacter sp.]
MAKIDEIALLNEVSLGDRGSFDALYNQYYSEIQRYVLKFVKAHDHTEDLCQEVFIKVWEKRQYLSEVNAFRPYLYKVAKNHILDFLRRAAVEQSLKENILRAGEQHYNTVEDSYQSEEYRQYLSEVLNNMSPRNQEVFKLCRDMDYTYDEAAEALGISRNAIKKHMVKIVKLLKYSAQKNFGVSFSVLVFLFPSFY